MRYLLVILFYCFPSTLLAQDGAEQFVIKRQRVIDNEHIFSPSEVAQLDSIIENCWEKEIADIAIVTIDDRHTDNENFENYVFQHLTSYALGHSGKNNGIVIAISKKLRQMRIENGRDIEKIFSNDATKKIIDEQFIPRFKEENYFEGTLNGLNAIVTFLEKVPKEARYENVSSIFWPSIFKKIRTFVLENGTPQTFRNLDNDNPSYNFTALDVFFGPSRRNSFVLSDFLPEDYYEMTIRDNDGSYYQFVYFEEPTPEQTFIHDSMQPGKVYWCNPDGRYLSTDLWPLLAQIEDEIAQKSAVKAGDTPAVE